jgi:hypothetical protein
MATFFFVCDKEQNVVYFTLPTPINHLCMYLLPTFLLPTYLIYIALIYGIYITSLILILN